MPADMFFYSAGKSSDIKVREKLLNGLIEKIISDFTKNMCIKLSTKSLFYSIKYISLYLTKVIFLSKPNHMQDSGVKHGSM